MEGSCGDKGWASPPEMIYAEYEIWEVMREEDREIEELREHWGCK
jgi:hypothetical protein